MGSDGFKYSIEEIRRACRILDLPEKATINDIKEHYRNLCHRWHPDLHMGTSTSDEKMKEINWAYRLLIEYCNRYLICFTNDAVENNRKPEDWWMKRFGNDPIWGPGDE